MFKKKKLTAIYTAYLKTNKSLFEKQDMLDKFWKGDKKYKTEIIQLLESAVTHKDIQKLKFCLGMAFRDGLDNDYSNIIYKIILENWHEEHESMVELSTTLKKKDFVMLCKEYLWTH